MSNKKRIVWITADYFLDVDILLVPYIQQTYEDWIVDWYILKTAKNIPIPEDKVTKIYPISYRGKDPRIIWSYYRALKDMHLDTADVVYSDFVGTPYYFPVLKWVNKKAPIVHAGHNVKPYAVWPKAMVKYIDWVFRHGQHFQIFSKEQLKYANEHYPTKDFFYCPMTVKSYGEVRTSNYDINPSKTNLLFFGNVVANKRLDLLIDVIKSLPEDIKGRLHLTVAGNNKEIIRYNTLIGNDPIISTYFKRIDDEDVPELFTKHNFLMLPYEDVAQSGPHMIAYHYNLPVIASNLDGFTERITDDVNGYIFVRNDKESLKKTIIKAATMTSQQYADMKNALSEYTQQNHSVESIADRYLHYFSSLK